MDFKTEFFKIGPCSVAYKGAIIGATVGSPQLNVEPGFYEAKCDQIDGKSVSKVIVDTKITVSLALKEVDGGFANICCPNEKITNVVFGEDVLTTGGNLCLFPIDNTNSYWFPKAVLVPETVSAHKNAKDPYLKMNFDIYKDLDGVLIEKHSKLN